jgi:hopanoid biosynthesis associated protein HpnK
MVAGPAAADAVARARRLPGLRVGLHLVLVEGRAITDPAQIPDLVGRSGDLRQDLVRFGLEIAARSAVRRQLAQEIRAQFEAYAATGLPLDHVDAHKHFHLHPVVARLIIAIGAQYGMRALRIPSEPSAVLAAIDPAASSARWRLMRPLTAGLRAQAARVGLTMPDWVFGLAWSGAMTAARLSALLARLPAGVGEIYLHPATQDRFPGSAPNYRYVDELAALTDPACIARVRSSLHRLGGYRDLTAESVRVTQAP